MRDDPKSDFFAPVHGSLVGIVALSVIGAVTGVVPFAAIVELERTLLPGLDGEPIDVARVWWTVVVAVVALFVSLGAAFGTGMVSHLADAELQHSLRRRIVRHRHLQSICDQIRQVAAAGAVVLLISHDDDLLELAADRQLVLTPPDADRGIPLPAFENAHTDQEAR